MKRLLFSLIVSASLVLSQTNRIPSLSLKMVDGKNTTVRQLLNDGPLLIDFWALWCAPCLKAMRHLDNFHEKYTKDNLRVLAINLDTERSRSKVRSYVRSKGYNFLVALDPVQESYRRLNGNVMPFTVLVSRYGEIVYKHTGYVPGDEKVLEEQIQSLVRQEATESSDSPPSH
ncbi:MAG: TlpA disulfide reductase family protein [Candidatus Marinimicrobia bacterium]|nr:TlpA disulfide reductase family protein [Candidatus Neomarinimicrobiota bacterium]MDP6592759.1 TlpA disulfide reductase family protein [Candidatus Neomarinimicrobiota bacterium]MDP6836280.1 TlpA disulfide reductase family protein [Candidatus Neomarinimicrobiota bacterium]MDP6966742.1 TlpA disulfide reductase family protein [Candidatus Neomarinimicrobiota bacterium]